MRRRALQDLDMVDQRSGEREVERVMPRMGIVEAHAVDKHQDLVERAAPHTDIRLRPVGTARTDIHTRQILKNIRHGLDGQRLDVLARNLRDESVGTGLYFSFVRYDRHLLKTKLSGIIRLLRLRRGRGLWQQRVCARIRIGGKSQERRYRHARSDGERLALLEQLEIRHIAGNATNRHLTVKRPKRSIRLVAEPTKTERLLE